jgi:hypothetical protein
MRRKNYSPVGRRFFLTMAILASLLFVGTFMGCGGGGSNDSGGDTAVTDTVDIVDDTDTGDGGDTADGEDAADGDAGTDGDGADSGDTGIGGEDDAGSDSEVTQITLNGDSITENLSGATAVGSELTITSAGTYSLTGTLNDGRIIVDTKDEEVVRLIFGGIDISCSDSAPVFIQDAEQVEIVLQEGSENFISDAESYVYEGDEDEPNAAIHSKDSLSISGSGALTVTGNYNDGITSKDGLIIDGGTITVNSVDDGIRGKDHIIVKDGDITISTTSGDGLLSDNEGDDEKGYITIEGGEFDITAGGDAIQAETLVTIHDGDFSLTTGGGDSGNFFYEGDSEKGIKGVVGVLIDGGSFFIDSTDDGIHANDFIEIDGGVFDIATGDDGIHADNTVDIFGGDVSISESYEGIESSVITISDGNFYIVSSDDGLNCAGGNDGSGFEGPGGGFTPAAGGDYALYIDGGYLAMYAQGDGLDSNGAIEMTGGTVLVHGPTSDWNGALDMGSFDITGGLLVAVGSSGMAESPSASSTQYSVLLNFSEKDAGTLFHIETSAGEEILTFRPAKRYESVVFSSPALSNGSSYTVYSGGSATGTLSDGLYSGGVYSPGTLNSDLDFTISSVVTTVGSGGGRR